jgi:hypothetical protein
MTSENKVPVPPQEIDDTALDAVAGAGEETVIFQYGAVEVGGRPRKGGDPDRPILVGGVPNPGK